MKPLIVANWKCNPITQKEAEQLFNSVAKESQKIKNVETVICPPFVFLLGLKLGLKPGFNRISRGAQDCFWEEKGAFTGEVSAQMLKDIGCKYVIAGHSERRKYFSETNETVNKKLKAVLDAGLNPIFCVGETKEERETGKIETVIKNQITEGLKDISSAKFDELVVAYEPVWAIGTGNPCSVEEAQKMRLFILKVISEIYSRNISGETRILYGGSANSLNSEGYIKEAGFSGLLVGGASLNAEEFVKIIKSAI